MMTRKHFETIAKVVNTEKVFCEENGESTIPILSLAIGLRVAFAEENPRFDSARFMTACGWPRAADTERPTS